jgi:heat-inducible transcriptional repressor
LFKKEQIDDPLSARARRILESVIHQYIRTAEPVGSPHLARQRRLKLSPASIRNTLGTLEKLGYLSQPHTSAGRVPTDKGYRYYVDSLMPFYTLSESIKSRIRKQVRPDRHDLDEILGQACQVLGLVSRQLGVTLSPRFQKGIFQRMEMVPLSDKRLLLVLTIKSGLVKTVVMEVGTSVPEHRLQETCRLLNERLSDLSIQEIRETLPGRVRDVSCGDPKLIQYMVDSAHLFFDFPEGGQLHFAGTVNIVNQPEFQDRVELRRLMGLLEEEKTLGTLLRQRPGEGVAVTIGRENVHGEMQHYSLLTARYHVGEIEGTLGIIGPTRMRYARLCAVVDYMARLLEYIWEE